MEEKDRILMAWAEHVKRTTPEYSWLEFALPVAMLAVMAAGIITLVLTNI